MNKVFSYFTILIMGSFLLAGCVKQNNENNETKEIKTIDTIESIVNDLGEENFVTSQVEDNPQFKIVDNTIISDNLPVVVDFYADWCGPCKQFAPIFNEAAKKYEGQAVFVRINVDTYKQLAETYKISSIPTTVFIQTGGGELGREVGVMDAGTLDGYINQLVATAAGNNMSL